jgi:hypothetical protein
MPQAVQLRQPYPVEAAVRDNKALLLVMVIIPQEHNKAVVAVLQ